MRCCRVGYAFIADNFIFLFADTPTGEYFLKPASAQQTDFDCLIQAHVEETKQAYAKFQEGSMVKAKADLFSNSFWAVQFERINVNQIVSIFERDYGGLNSCLDFHTASGKTFSFTFQDYTH